MDEDQAPFTEVRKRESPFLLATRRLEEEHRLEPLVDVIARSARPLGEGRAREVLGGRWLGHALHPLLTDFPLGCWLGAGLLDLFGGRRSRPAAQRLVGMGVAFTVPTALAGLSDWTTTSNPKARRVGVAHAVLNTVVTVIYWRSWSARRDGRHTTGVLLGMVASSGAWASGYLGGHLSLRHGVGTGEPGYGSATLTDASDPPNDGR